MKSNRTLCMRCIVVFLAASSGALAAGPLLFDTIDSTAGGPPYPSTSAVRIGVYEASDLLPAVQRSQLAIGIEQLLVDDVARPSSLLGKDNGAGVPFGDQAGLDLAIDFDVDIQASVQLLIRSLTPDGKDPVATEIRSFSWGERSFEIEFGELMGDGSVNIQRMLGEIPEAQDFHFKTFSALAGSVLLDFTLERTGPDQEPDAPMVVMSISGENVPEPATAMLLAGGAAMFLRRRKA